MKLTIGMPEILILFSALMYSQSYWFAITAFCLGLVGRIASYLMDYGTEMKKAEAINKSADELGSALTGLFGGSQK